MKWSDLRSIRLLVDKFYFF